MFASTYSHSNIGIPGNTKHFLDPLGPEPRSHGRLRYLKGGTGEPLVLLDTVRSLAYTLIGGGTFAGTILTLVCLPAMYSIRFKIKPNPSQI